MCRKTIPRVDSQAARRRPFFLSRRSAVGSRRSAVEKHRQVRSRFGFCYCRPPTADRRLGPPSTIARSDRRTFMRRALELAERGRYSVSPNPMVGCVIVARRRGHRRGVASTRRRGACGDRRAAACADPRGATMYVTLEPCAHHGRTAPCADAVIAAGVARVVVAMHDPHDVVNGRGLAAMRAAGIEVVVGVLEAEARRLNEKFVWSVTQQLPFVLLKAAMTLDGKLATVARESQWITARGGARAGACALREEYDAILVGSGTVEERQSAPHPPPRPGRRGDALDARGARRRRRGAAARAAPHRRRPDASSSPAHPRATRAAPNLEIVAIGRPLRSRARLRRALRARHPLGDRRRRLPRPLRVHPPRAVAEDDPLRRPAARRRRRRPRHLQRRRRHPVDRRVSLSV